MSIPKITDKAIFGREDSRIPLYQLKSHGYSDAFVEKVQEQARSVACLMRRSFFDPLENGYHLRLPENKKLSKVLRQRHKEETNEDVRVARSEKFRREYSLGESTAFLFAPQYIITAAHCLCEKSSDKLDAERIKQLCVVFGFQRDVDKTLKTFYPKTDVYSIDSVPIHRYSRGSHWEDWAIVRLDKEVVGRRPLIVDNMSEVTIGKDVYMLGHPLGMPMMLTRGGEVKATKGAQFQTTLDAFSGNSGSPIFSEEGKFALGMLISGHEDYSVVEVKGKRRIRAVHVTQTMTDEAGFEACQKLRTIFVFEIIKSMQNLPKMDPSLKEFAYFEPLLKVYRKQGYIKRFLDTKLVSIDHSYITLKIVEQESFEKMERGGRNLTTQAGRENSSSLPLSELFKENSRIYIEGSAGSGKSSFCRFLVYKWATSTSEERRNTLGPWTDKYEAVVWLQLREIRRLSRSATLSDFVTKMYPELRFDKIDSEKTLYILDSFDEIASLEKNCSKSRKDKRWDIVSSLIDQPNWLMTSRPGLFSEKFSGCRRLQNIGFSEENIRVYVSRFCDDFKRDKDTLEAALLGSGNLKKLAQIPLYLELLCSLWKEDPKIITSLSTPVTVYNAMAIQLFLRHIYRIQRVKTEIPDSRVLNHPDVKSYRECLEVMAFKSIISDSSCITSAIYNPIFAAKPLDQLKDDEMEKFGERLFIDMGFLAPCGDPKSLFMQDYSFIHPTFQEYFAARHVASVLGSNQKLVSGEAATDWLKTNCHVKESEGLIDFIASLIQTDEQAKDFAKGISIPRESTVAQNSYWENPLERVTSMGIVLLARILINESVKADRVKLGELLRLAAWNGHKEMVNLLIDKGADVSAVDKEKMQALHLAAWNGHRDVVKLLIDNGANVNEYMADGASPLDWAVRNGQIEVVKLFLWARARICKTTLYQAILSGNEAIVRILIANGANIHEELKFLQSPLDLAINYKKEAIVKLLIDKGVNLVVGDDRGRVPLARAAASGSIEIVKLILSKYEESRLSKEWLFQQKNAALIQAIEKGHTPIVKLLLDANANLYTISEDRMTLLHIAAEKGHLELVGLLLSKGVGINLVDANGWSAMHWAAQKGHIEVVGLLIEKDAEVSLANKDGTQPLHMAAEGGHREVVKLLLKRGARADARDSSGRQPLDWAKEGGHQGVIEVLQDWEAKAD